MKEYIILLIYCAVLLLMSFFTFIIYAKDKRMSKGNSAKRIQEKTLLGFTAFGGALGAFLARLVFRHKTNKIYFSFTIYMSLLFELLVLAALLFVYVF